MSDGPFGRRPDAPEPPRAPAPAPPPPPPPPARITSNVTWLIGVLALVIFTYITVNSIRTEGPGSRGLEPGDRMPVFAAPLAMSDLDGDANIDPEKACGVRGPRVLNLCEMYERGPVALVFYAERSARCKRQVDVVEGLRARFPQVQFATVAIRGDRAAIRRTVRERGWEIPVGWDRDGAVANLYAVAICPTITFARRGGRIVSTALSYLGEADLEARLRGL